MNGTLLGIPSDAESADDGPWNPVDAPPPESTAMGSALEQRFYSLVLQRLGKDGLGLTVKEVPGPHGNTARFVGGGREWTLVPQVNVAASKPDFMLTCNDANVPETAVFVDGHAFHATVKHNRMADDAQKRAHLRATGRRVVAVTARDIELAEAKKTVAPTWWSQEIVGKVISLPATAASPKVYQDLGTGVVDQIASWVQEPARAERERAANAVPMFLLAGGVLTPAAEGASLATIAVDALTGEAAEAEGTAERSVLVRRWGAVAVAIESLGGGMIGVALVLDDRDAVIDGAHADAWRVWLELSNALGTRDWPTTITTVTAAGADAEVAPATPVTATSGLPPEWSAVVDLAQQQEIGLLVELAHRGDVPVPTIGAEGSDGIPLDVAWPDSRIVVDVAGMPEDDRRDLERGGWRVLGADDVDAVVAAVLNDREDDA